MLKPDARPRVLNKRTDEIPPSAVYVGRPTRWGNPFIIPFDGDRQTVVARYRDSMTERDKREARRELRGKDLVCWCAPDPCHADVLLEIANGWGV